MATPSETIKKLALDEGFDAVGIAPAERLDRESARFREWLSRGYQATMSWMADGADKRTDPSRVLEGARTVVSLAKNYYTPFEHRDATAKISRYAWGDDYHIVIDRMLKRLAGRLKDRWSENKFVYYCDTGPVMDKAWAERAGIGWIGKHTNVINRRLGSWIFLSELITDLECDHDDAATDRCGSCRACIDACPTNAIVEPYVLDSNRCISFLTIENRGDSIPGEFLPDLESWVFGCDICQDVCPWNARFGTSTNEKAFLPREGILNLKVEDVHLMTREDFTERFRRSPVKRAKFGGLKRNADALSAGGKSGGE